MINFTKELPQNTTLVQSEHVERYSKVPMTAPSRGNPCYPQWIITSSGACLGQHLGHSVYNGQQAAVLHASVRPFYIMRSLKQDSEFEFKLSSNQIYNTTTTTTIILLLLLLSLNLSEDLVF